MVAEQTVLPSNSKYTFIHLIKKNCIWKCTIWLTKHKAQDVFCWVSSQRSLHIKVQHVWGEPPPLWSSLHQRFPIFIASRASTKKTKQNTKTKQGQRWCTLWRSHAVKKSMKLFCEPTVLFPLWSSSETAHTPTPTPTHTNTLGLSLVSLCLRHVHTHVLLCRLHRSVSYFCKIFTASSSSSSAPAKQR